MPEDDLSTGRYMLHACKGNQLDFKKNLLCIRLNNCGLFIN